MATQPPPPATPSASTTPSTLKQIHSLVLDTGPLVKNDPPTNVLRAKAEHLYTLPSVIPEIRDAATRARLETQLLPFLTVRAPRPASVKVIQDFARRTGDLSVLSRPDIEVLALGYELELERNGGDWRLRSMPGQKQVNGKSPHQTEESNTAETEETTDTKGPSEANAEQAPVRGAQEDHVSRPTTEEQSLDSGMEKLHLQDSGSYVDQIVEDPELAKVEAHTIPHESAPAADMAQTTIVDGEKADESTVLEEQADQDNDDDDDNGDGDDDEDDDADGWITPSNLKKHQAKDAGTSNPTQPVQKLLQAAVLTSDYAMQNVALRMNLNLVAPTFARITHVKTWVLRCHGCFKITRDTDRQFCPSCGQPTLMRASCSTDDRGNFRVHLKKNFQWNNRGNVYSVPKPTHGSANGRLPSGGGGANRGGQNGWGRDLILSEDQKEYTRAADERRRTKKKDLMDQDTLPDILSGARSGSGGKIRVGAGRNVNSRRKHK